MKDLSRAIAILLFISLPFFTQATNSLKIIINEIAWMGTTVSYNDEWIELYNNIDLPVSLDKWILKAKNGTLEIKLAGIISAKGFYLLERTDDNTVPNISTDQVYTGALKNKGGILELRDNFGNLIDSVGCSAEWFAGDNKTKQTMERKNPQATGNSPENWQNSQKPDGTPKAKNSSGVKIDYNPPSTLTPPQKTEIKFLEEEPAKIGAKKELAAIGKQAPESSNSLFVLLIALGAAIFSGMIILILKRVLKLKT